MCCELTTKKTTLNDWSNIKCCDLSHFACSFFAWQCFPDAKCVPLTRILREVPLQTPWPEKERVPVRILADIPVGDIILTAINPAQCHNKLMTVSFPARQRVQELSKQPKIRP